MIKLIMDIDWQSTLSQLDDLVKKGQGYQVKKVILSWEPKSIPRRHLTRVSNLCRRVGIVEHGLKLLNPIVRPTRRESFTSTPQEQIEYAANLIRIGAVTEGSEILSPLDEIENPEINLHHAFSLIAQWQYAEAIPILTSYINHEKLSHYQKIVGKVNLLACLVYVRERKQCKELSKELIDVTKREGLLLLHGNCLELLAQVLIGEGSYKQASRKLEMAAKNHQKISSTDSFFVKKWMKIIEAIKTNNIEPLLFLKKDAIKIQHWETVRHCDFHIGVILKDLNYLSRVYYGTPFDSFKSQVMSELPYKSHIADEYFWQPGIEQSNNQIQTKNYFDIQQGEDNQSKAILKSGKLLHRLLDTLCHDFYRPFTIPLLHAELFPGDYYNPFSSPDRIHQCISRLRNWFEKHHIPVEILFKNGGFQLHSLTQDFSFRRTLSKTSTKKDSIHYIIEKILQERPKREGFKSLDVAEVLCVSQRSAGKKIYTREVKRNMHPDEMDSQFEYIAALLKTRIKNNQSSYANFVWPREFVDNENQMITLVNLKKSEKTVFEHLETTGRHGIQIVGYENDSFGKIKYWYLQNTHGDSVGRNGVYQMEHAFFRKFLIGISFPQ